MYFAAGGGGAASGVMVQPEPLTPCILKAAFKTVAGGCKIVTTMTTGQLALVIVGGVAVTLAVGYAYGKVAEYKRETRKQKSHRC